MAEKVLILRTCKPDATSFGGFQWPRSGHVVCPDWEPSHDYWNGLHGWLWGEGNGALGYIGPNAIWMVLEVNAKDVVDLTEAKVDFYYQVPVWGTVKFPECDIVFSGAQIEATRYILDRAPDKIVIGATLSTKDSNQVVRVGDYGMAVCGDKSLANTGFRGVAKTGDMGEAYAGINGIAITGKEGKSYVSYGGTAISGANGYAYGKDYAIASTGDYGSSETEIGGAAITGNYGSATTGQHGTVKGGTGSTLRIIEWRDHAIEHIAKVGKRGIRPDTFYRICNGKFVEAM